MLLSCSAFRFHHHLPAVKLIKQWRRCIYKYRMGFKKKYKEFSLMIGGSLTIGTRMIVGLYRVARQLWILKVMYIFLFNYWKVPFSLFSFADRMPILITISHTSKSIFGNTQIQNQAIQYIYIYIYWMA